MFRLLFVGVSFVTIVGGQQSSMPDASSRQLGGFFFSPWFNGAPWFTSVTSWFNSLATKVVVVTDTVTVTESQFCASLVNVTGPCRQKRDFIERPIIISLDDDIDLFNPTPVR